MTSSDQVHVVDGPDLTAADVYAIWQVRDVVFAVEQQCDEPDVDGIDLLPSCTHLWVADEHGIRSYLRTYVAEAGYRKIGRVCTRKDQRGLGLSGRLVRAAHDRWGADEIHIGAQAYLHDWYAGFGYERSGENFFEAGIEHVPMVRPGQ
ncbi:GNAT family N-acetyltransferase [Aeromicrobium sp. Root495]|uniref:GNAT family N-acetyltransferase n=1 Tax=Aeromicrobium sp. Root495 TaxID=1736550 RepID=UPI000A7E54DD|nr:GNAT family N-acetyltransferase [Aeromicrobium sp. Root495]RYJ05132.1 MAG: GNAT family N-acetyltransferase [Actinomycetales bacterium]